MANTHVRTNLTLQGGLRLNESADFPAGAKPGQTCFKDGVLYVRGEVGGVQAWFPINAPQGHYVHVQGAAARVWEVNHGFTSENVAVLAYADNGDAIPATVVLSSGLASIDVGSSRTGYAVVFGLAFASVAQGVKADSAVQPGDLASVATSGAYSDLSGRPTLGSAAYEAASTFASASHGHAWGDLSSVPATASRWPSFAEVSGKPTVYPAESHTHAWSEVTGKPGTATRWPAWNEVASKPSTFPPASHNHDSDYVKKSGDTLIGDLTVYKENPWLTVESSRDGEVELEQSAGISIGESGYKGAASLHLVYIGDGHGYIGMGSIDEVTGEPALAAMKFRYTNRNVEFLGRISGDGSGLTGTASLRATGTTQSDVGLPNARNVASYSQTESNNRYAPKSHNHNGHHALKTDLSNALTQLADAFNQGASDIAAVTIQDYSRHL